ncbi:MAG: 50S ribosomal protein L30 [Chloroflexi bacterium]|nr:50S ribosomal protein L30 [Chloroflexota bacterium]
MAGRLRVTQVKSTISHIARNRATVRALGLHRIGDVSVVTDNEATRGMVRQVRFLVEVEEIADKGATDTAASEPSAGPSAEPGSARRRSGGRPKENA